MTNLQKMMGDVMSKDEPDEGVRQEKSPSTASTNETIINQANSTTITAEAMGAIDDTDLVAAAGHKVANFSCDTVDVSGNTKEDQKGKDPNPSSSSQVSKPSESDSIVTKKVAFPDSESSIFYNGQTEPDDVQMVPSCPVIFSTNESKPAFVPTSELELESLSHTTENSAPEISVALKREPIHNDDHGTDCMTPAKKIKVESEGGPNLVPEFHIDTWRAKASDRKLKLNTKVRVIRIDKYIGNKVRCRLNRELWNMTLQTSGSNLDSNIKRDWFEEVMQEEIEVQDSSSISMAPIAMPSLIPKPGFETSAASETTVKGSAIPLKPHLVERPRNLSREEVFEKAKEYCAINEDIQIEQSKPISRYGRIIKPKKLDEDFVQDGQDMQDLTPGERTPPAPPLLKLEFNVSDERNLSNGSRRFSLNLTHGAPNVQTGQKSGDKGIMSRRASERDVNLCRNLERAEVAPMETCLEDLHMPKLTRYDNDPLPLPKEIPRHTRKRNLSSGNSKIKKPLMKSLEEQHNEEAIETYSQDHPGHDTVSKNNPGLQSNDGSPLPESEYEQKPIVEIVDADTKLDTPKADSNHCNQNTKLEFEPSPRKVPSLKIQLGGVNRDEYKILPPSPVSPEEGTKADCSREVVHVPVTPLQEELAMEALQLEEKRLLRSRHKSERSECGENKSALLDVSQSQLDHPPQAPTPVGQVTNGSKKKKATRKFLKKFRKNRRSCPANLAKSQPVTAIETATATPSSRKTEVLPEIEPTEKSIDAKAQEVPDNKKLETKLPINGKEVQVRLRRLSPRMAKTRQAIMSGTVNTSEEQGPGTPGSSAKKPIHPVVNSVKKSQTKGKINGEVVGPYTSQPTQNRPKTFKIEGTNLNGIVVKPNGLSHEGFQPLAPVVCLESTLIKDHIYMVSQAGGSVKLMLFDGLIFQPIFHEHFSALKAQQTLQVETTECMETT